MSQEKNTPEPIRVDLGERAGFPVALEFPADKPAELELVEPGGIEVADLPILAESLRGMVMDDATLGANPTLGAVFYPFDAGEPGQVLGPIDLEVGITAILPGRLGDEYHRTPGYAAPETPVLIEAWHGTGTLYLQDGTEPDLNDTLTIALAPGSLAVVPPGWAYAVSNTGDKLFVFAEYDSDTAQASSKALEPLGGCAHYLYRGNKGVELELNPSYRTVPLPRKVETANDDALGLTQGKPFFAALKDSPDTYRWLTKPETAADALKSLYAEGDGWL